MCDIQEVANSIINLWHVKLPISRMNKTIGNSLTRNIPLNNKTGSRGKASRVEDNKYIHPAIVLHPNERTSYLSITPLSLIHHRRCRDRCLRERRKREGSVYSRSKAEEDDPRTWRILDTRVSTAQDPRDTQVLSRIRRIQRCNPFISVWATRSIIPDKTSDSIVNRGTMPRRGHVFYFRSLSAKCAWNWQIARNLRTNFSFSLNYLFSTRHSAVQRRKRSSQNLEWSKRRLHLVCSPRVCDRNRRSIKKRRDRNLPEQIGRSVFWLILLGRAKPLLSLRPPDRFDSCRESTRVTPPR